MGNSQKPPPKFVTLETQTYLVLSDTLQQGIQKTWFKEDILFSRTKDTLRLPPSAFLVLRQSSLTVIIGFCSVYVGRIMLPKDDYALILRTCEYTAFHGKRNFADVIKNLKMGYHPRLSSSPNKGGSFQMLEKARKGIFPKCLQQAALPWS